jgi:hypothetical protein
METKNMSVPHSVVHARNYSGAEKDGNVPVTTKKDRKEPGVKGMVSFDVGLRDQPVSL